MVHPQLSSEQVSLHTYPVCRMQSTASQLTLPGKRFDKIIVRHSSWVQGAVDGGGAGKQAAQCLRPATSSADLFHHWVPRVGTSSDASRLGFVHLITQSNSGVMAAVLSHSASQPAGTVSEAALPQIMHQQLDISTDTSIASQQLGHAHSHCEANKSRLGKPQDA